MPSLTDHIVSPKKSWRKEPRDTHRLWAYLERDCPHGEPIILNLGETWSKAPQGLTERLATVPAYAHGYQLSMYGLPKLQATLRQYLIRTHQLEQVPETAFEVAVTWSGTRSIMYDYGRFLLQSWQHQTTPVVIATSPGWDYTGVFEPQGFRMRYLQLRPDEQFYPNWSAFLALMDEIAQRDDEQPALVIINSQHNPTGMNWSPEFVRDVLQFAEARGIAVMIDDAYYGVHSPKISPTSALRILHELLVADPSSSLQQRWLSVRSMGKQFHSNGWGLGVFSADPGTVAAINDLRGQHVYPYNAMLQYALADWLNDPESDAFLREEAEGYEQKRAWISAYLQSHLGYPAAQIHPGECTSYMIFAVPPVYAQHERGVQQFIDDCFFHTGVLVSSTWATMFVGAQPPVPLDYVRIFIGLDLADLQTAFERLYNAGFSYTMPEIMRAQETVVG
jgi:aspartate/methionine/tyrosine aminotransferase